MEDHEHRCRLAVEAVEAKTKLLQEEVLCYYSSLTRVLANSLSSEKEPQVIQAEYPCVAQA